MPNDSPGESVEQRPIEKSPRTKTSNAPSSPDYPSSPEAQAIPHKTEEAEIKKLESRVRRAEKWMIWLTAAIAFFALCSVVVGSFQWDVMKKSTDLAYRPYIGVNGVNVGFAYKDSAGVMHQSQLPLPKDNILGFRVEIKNFGPVPGSNYMGPWRSLSEENKDDLPKFQISRSPFSLVRSCTLLGNSLAKIIALLFLGRKSS